jgi:hypothetical protein
MYLLDAFEKDFESIKRKNYDSQMLLYIVQLHAKDPEKLKQYVPFLDNYGFKKHDKKTVVDKKSGEDMILDFLGVTETKD